MVGGDGSTPGGRGPTVTGELVGTPSYMAPEQAMVPRQTVGPATDVYALGAILYELLSGRPPFVAGTALATVLQVLHNEPASLGSLQSSIPRRSGNDLPRSVFRRTQPIATAARWNWRKT